jgi:hypothetical protein
MRSGRTSATSRLLSSGSSRSPHRGGTSPVRVPSNPAPASRALFSTRPSDLALSFVRALAIRRRSRVQNRPPQAGSAGRRPSPAECRASRPAPRSGAAAFLILPRPPQRGRRQRGGHHEHVGRWRTQTTALSMSRASTRSTGNVSGNGTLTGPAMRWTATTTPRRLGDPPPSCRCCDWTGIAPGPPPRAWDPRSGMRRPDRADDFEQAPDVRHDGLGSGMRRSLPSPTASSPLAGSSTRYPDLSQVGDVARGWGCPTCGRSSPEPRAPARWPQQDRTQQLAGETVRRLRQEKSPWPVRRR